MCDDATDGPIYVRSRAPSAIYIVYFRVDDAPRGGCSLDVPDDEDNDAG